MYVCVSISLSSTFLFLSVSPSVCLFVCLCICVCVLPRGAIDHTQHIDATKELVDGHLTVGDRLCEVVRG